MIKSRLKETPARHHPIHFIDIASLWQDQSHDRPNWSGLRLRSSEQKRVINLCTVINAIENVIYMDAIHFACIKRLLWIKFILGLQVWGLQLNEPTRKNGISKQNLTRCNTLTSEKCHAKENIHASLPCLSSQIAKETSQRLVQTINTNLAIEANTKTRAAQVHFTTSSGTLAKRGLWLGSVLRIVRKTSRRDIKWHWSYARRILLSAQNTIIWPNSLLYAAIRWSQYLLPCLWFANRSIASS